MSTKTRALVHELGPSENSPTFAINVHRQRDSAEGRHSLEISFKRTVRVSDNDNVNNLPPGLDSFPLFEISDYNATLPAIMAAKGGYFLPMHQREAMWIKFTSKDPFAIKIHVGGVNAVSGEAYARSEESKLAQARRRHDLLSHGKSIQDYVVTPKQQWIDGIASEDGTVRQFVAMPLGTGYSVEAQVTGVGLIGGLQVEVTPAKEEITHRKFTSPSAAFVPSVVFHKPAGTPHFQVAVRTLTGRSVVFDVSALHTVDELKSMLQDKEGIPPDQQRLIFEGRQLEDNRTLGYYGLKQDCIIHLVLRLIGGGGPVAEMGVAAGGLIKQSIHGDDNSPTIWDPASGTIFNVQILNSEVFEAVTGKKPPKTPITAKTYADPGFPYYSIYDEKPSGINGDFAGVKSVAQKDCEGLPTLAKAEAVAEVIETTNNPVVLFDKDGRYTGDFCPVKHMEKELRKKFATMSFD